ncbi:MAG TPA: hypothetical protein VEU97_06995 [Ktedonobacteraceae bacterium]|nr:hypothetical protein [Ktedonobacteraceae bacterium]
MSFTADEIQSFNDILDRKLTAHRQEMERAFDQRIQTLRHDIERHLNTAQLEIITNVTQKLADEQRKMQTNLGQKLNAQEHDISQTVGNEIRHQVQQLQPQVEGVVDRALAVQFLAIEGLLNQRFELSSLDDTGTDVQVGERPAHFEAIEVQTELPWEDLIDIFGKALDERFANLNRSTQESMRNWEQYLAQQLRLLQSKLHDEMVHARQPQAYSGNLTSMQELFQSIEHLEHIIESLQVAMTANHAFLSNRLYHHQQLPLERAHGSQQSTDQVAHPNGTGSSSPRSLTGERGGQPNNS